MLHADVENLEQRDQGLQDRRTSSHHCQPAPPGQDHHVPAIGHARGNGPADHAETPKVLATPDTPMCLFSTSKAVTAVLMHMLAEDGLINVMDPVSFYAPEFARRARAISPFTRSSPIAVASPACQRTSPWIRYGMNATWELLCDAEPIMTDGSSWPITRLPAVSCWNG